MGKIIIALLILFAISLPITCMTLITDEHGFGLSLVTNEVHAFNDNTNQWLQ
jgi:hypothetical protein|tara:strand:+ start:885 stop:1040 length:156 start_codon:yes stop_codon:yes gene_type:complete